MKRDEFIRLPRVEREFAAVSFIEKHTPADGIISSKPNIIKHAKAHKLLMVRRFFLISLHRTILQQLVEPAAALEILPEIISKITGGPVQTNIQAHYYGGRFRTRTIYANF